MFHLTWIPNCIIYHYWSSNGLVFVGWQYPFWKYPSHCCLVLCAAQNELHLPVPDGAYPPLASLIHACLAHAHEQRPTFADITRDLEVRLSDRVSAWDWDYLLLSTVAPKTTRA